MKRVSFQGEPGAYSEAAAVSFFDDKIKTIPCPTFAKVLKNTEDNEGDYSILPIENSLEGSVGESNDLLLATNLTVIGETYHRIQHCLIGTGSIEDIDTVYSHPQAVGQCRHFIQDQSLKTVPSYDTAGSVRTIKDLKKDSVACIASRNAAEIFGVAVIQEGIDDNVNNYTRFLIFSKENSAQRMTTRDNLSKNNALEIVQKRYNENKIIYKTLYGFEIGENLSVFDKIIETDGLNAEQVLEIAKSTVREYF